MALGTYSFKNVNAIFGVAELEGFADGDDVINIEPSTDAFAMTVGAKGDVTRSATNDESVTITMKFLQTSKSVPVLQNIFLGDKATGNGVLPILITDKDAGETFTVKNAWIMKQPTITRGQGQNPYEVVFQGDVFIPVIL